VLDYRYLFEQTPARLLVLSPEPSRYKILAASDAYLGATVTTREIVSRPLFEVFPDNPGDPSADGVHNLGASLERALATRSRDMMRVQRYDVRDLSGHFVERHWAPVNATVVGGDGTIVALIHRVEDVTSFVQQGACLSAEAAHLKHEIIMRGCELAMANATLRDTVEQRRKIVAIVAHDLRGPLSVMRSGVEVMRRHFTNLGAAPPRMIDTLKSSSERMGDLLNDLDDYTATQVHGLLPIERQHTNVRAICEEVVHAEQLAHPHRLVELLPGENISAFVDPRRNRQLLTNLINNALTYGAADRPVRVSLRRVTRACVITVSNEGDPIPEEAIPLLFEPFRRGPGKGNGRQRGHMGLGLFIVQQIVEAHDGTIGVESTPQGTHFSVYIPVART
jgi:signal transduction histidine kinase